MAAKPIARASRSLQRRKAGDGIDFPRDPRRGHHIRRTDTMLATIAVLLLFLWVAGSVLL